MDLNYYKATMMQQQSHLYKYVNRFPNAGLLLMLLNAIASKHFLTCRLFPKFFV